MRSSIRIGFELGPWEGLEGRGTDSRERGKIYGTSVSLKSYNIYLTCTTKQDVNKQHCCLQTRVLSWAHLMLGRERRKKLEWLITWPSPTADGLWLFYKYCSGLCASWRGGTAAAELAYRRPRSSRRPCWIDLP